jgi:4-hydroxy-4-methyl-2-oxoglutarate aldolase
MPVWCRGPSPTTTKLLGLEGAFNVPISVGGQAVSPGDAILADESGVLVLKPDQAEAAAKRAIDMQNREVTVLARIEKGEKLGQISGATRLVEAAITT